LSARIASRLAPSIDTGIRYAAAVTQITGGGDRSFGVNIHVHRHDAPLDEPDPGQALRLSWSGLAADALVERVTVHLHRGRPFREPQRAAIQALLGGRPLRAVFGPGRGRRPVMGVTAAAWVVAGRGPVVIAVPLQSLVDRWYERLAPRAREIGVRCARAHGALRFRQRQHLLQSLQNGAVDLLLASIEFLKSIGTDGEAAPVQAWLRPSLLLAECEPTIEDNALDDVARVLGRPLRGDFQGSAAPAEDALRLAAAEIITDPFPRINLRLVDRRGAQDREAMLLDARRQGKALLYTGQRAAAIDLASRLREQNPGQVAYYHGGLPLRVREVLEQQFADGKIQALVAAVYRIVRAEVERAGMAAWPDDRPDAALQREGIAPRAIGIGLDILAEAGVIQRDYDGDRWRITLSGQERRDLLTSLRYAEGHREAEAFQEMSRWAFGPLTDILKAVAGPGIH